MFFCVRILFMRLSQSSLNKMFKTIWPGLIAILIQIFTSKNKHSKNINLILAALKVVELIHALDIEEFNFHKWIFITDCKMFMIYSFRYQNLTNSPRVGILKNSRFRSLLKDSACWK